MNREVHFVFTQRWALEEGFSEADALAIAEADWACDRLYITTLAHKRYHWPIYGSPVVALRRYRAAVRGRDLTALGEALHALQDTIGHGVHGHVWHWPGIDRWEHRGPAVRRRLERNSRRMLAAYLRSTREDAATPAAQARESSGLAG